MTAYAAPDARGGNRPRMTDTAPDGLLHVAAHRRRPGRQHYKACESSSSANRLAWIALDKHLHKVGETQAGKEVDKMPTILTAQEKRDLLKQVEGRGKAPNPETVALAATFASWDKAFWSEPVLQVSPDELGLKQWCADVDTPKEHADGTPYVSNSRKVFSSHVRQALKRAGIDYTGGLMEARDGKAVLILTPVNHREKKSEVEDES